MVVAAEVAEDSEVAAAEDLETVEVVAEVSEGTAETGAAAREARARVTRGRETGHARTAPTPTSPGGQSATSARSPRKIARSAGAVVEVGLEAAAEGEEDLEAEVAVTGGEVAGTEGGETEVMEEDEMIATAAEVTVEVAMTEEVVAGLEAAEIEMTAVEGAVALEAAEGEGLETGTGEAEGAASEEGGVGADPWGVAGAGTGTVLTRQ